MNLLGWLGVPGIKVRNSIIWMYPELSNGWSIQYVQKVYRQNYNTSCLIQGILINWQSWEYWHYIQNVYNDYKQVNSYQISRFNASYCMIHTAPQHYYNIPFLWHYIWHAFYYHFITTTIYAYKPTKVSFKPMANSCHIWYVFDTVIWLNEIVFNLFAIF